MGRFVSIDARCVSITPTSWQGQRICASYSFEAKITELMCCMCTVILIDITVSWGEHPYLYIYIYILIHVSYILIIYMTTYSFAYKQTDSLFSSNIKPATQPTGYTQRKRLMVERPPGDSPISKVHTTSDGKLQTPQRLEPFEWVHGILGGWAPRYRK